LKSFHVRGAPECTHRFKTEQGRGAHEKDCIALKMRMETDEATMPALPFKKKQKTDNQKAANDINEAEDEISGVVVMSATKDFAKAAVAAADKEKRNVRKVIAVMCPPGDDNDDDDDDDDEVETEIVPTDGRKANRGS
jgi:hypothetical protein